MSRRRFICKKAREKTVAIEARVANHVSRPTVASAGEPKVRKLAFVLFGAALGVVAIEPAALAGADAPVLQATPPAPSWTGLYVGINAGDTWGRAETALSVANGVPGPNGYFADGNIPTVAAKGSNQIGDSGGFGGGQIGYLWQVGPIVGGLELGLDRMTATGSIANSADYPLGGSFGFDEKVSAEWLFTGLARAGVDLGPLYPYATGGLAVADLKYVNTFIDKNFCTNCPAVGTMNQGKAGLVGGAGLEWRLDSHWSLRGEYLYTYFGDVNGRTIVVGEFSNYTSTLIHKASFSENVARAALDYRF
ncbi:MAG: outer membrane beta-barrel protein [Roseiarcus sp.]